MLDVRQRTGYLLLALMVGQLILISAQVQSKSGVPVLTAVTFGVFSEIQRGAAGVIGRVRGVWSGYVGLRGARVENAELRRQVAELQVRLQEQRALALRSQRLEQLLELRSSVGVPTLPAQVIAADPAASFQTITIDKGRDDGLRPDMAVIAPAGAVGRVVLAGARASKVQLLIDSSAAAGAVIERSRASGVVMGQVGDPPLQMEYVSNLADVKPGDLVVTSGIDGIYPKGFTIGRVEQVERGAGMYKTLKVRPALDFAGLEEVLVVLTPPADSPAVEGSR